MYSPRIRDEFIPALYRLAKARGVPMTRLINDVVAREVSSPQAREEIARVQIPPRGCSVGHKGAAA